MLGGKDNIATLLLLVIFFIVTSFALKCGDWEGYVNFSGCVFVKFASDRWRERGAIGWLLDVVVLNMELFFAKPPNISARLETKLFVLADSEEVSLFSLSLSFVSRVDL